MAIKSSGEVMSLNPVRFYRFKLEYGLGDRKIMIKNNSYFILLICMYF